MASHRCRDLVRVAIVHDWLDTWRGGENVLAEIVRLEELHLTCLEERVEADLALGLASVLVAELRRLVAEHPVRERLRGQLMLALYRGGRQADALACYHATRRSFLDELGLEPSQGLRDLEQANSWYQKSADAGCAQGSLGLGLALLAREEESGALKQAAVELTKATAGGLGTAMYLLGVMTERGAGVGDEVWFNRGDDRYYTGSSRDCTVAGTPCPKASQQTPVLGVINAATNTLIEKKLGVRGTGRNWNTVLKLAALCG